MVLIIRKKILIQNLLNLMFVTVSAVNCLRQIGKKDVKQYKNFMIKDLIESQVHLAPNFIQRSMKSDGQWVDRASN